MLELKNWYRDRLPTRIAALEEAREGVTKRTSDAIDAVRRIGHSLRGSGATYGFPEITEAARALEEAEEGAILERLEALVQTLRTVHAAGRTLRTSILIVEDDEDQARFIAEAIASPDRDLFEARTAAEAQAILEEKEVSLILLDLILPDTDGRNFLLKLRERLATATVPVIVLTVKRAVQAKAECLALGADDFIEKPVARETPPASVRGRRPPARSGATRSRGSPTAPPSARSSRGRGTASPPPANRSPRRSSRSTASRRSSRSADPPRPTRPSVAPPRSSRARSGGPTSSPGGAAPSSPRSSSGQARPRRSARWRRPCGPCATSPFPPATAGGSGSPSRRASRRSSTG